MTTTHETRAADNGADTMRNPATRELYAYWNRIRRARFAPWRSEVEPADIHGLLPDIFIAEARGTSDFRFRLAGTRICAVYRKELKGRDLFEHWSDADREGFDTLLHNVSRDGAAGIVRASGMNLSEQSAQFEMIVLPLRHHNGEISRFIGAVSAVETPYWLGASPIISHQAESVRIIWPDDQPEFGRRFATGEPANQPAAHPIGLAAGGGPRRVGHLTVYDGGLTGE